MRKIYCLLLMCCLLGFSVAQAQNVDPSSQSIVFITDDDRDDEQINLLKSLGFNVSVYYNSSLSTAPDAEIDMLNAADLVIIGRSPSSNHLGGSNAADKVAWNGLTSPLILNSQWGARSTRLNWFDFGDNLSAYTVAEIVPAEIKAPEDAVFDNVEIGQDNLLPWVNATEDFLFPNTPTNGEILAVTPAGAAGSEAGGAVLMVRFATGTEFYEGAGDAPAGPRTYFGFGSDGAGGSYFPLTPESQQVYVDEVNRILGTNVILPEDPATKTVVFFTDDEQDDEQITWLTNRGLNIKTYHHSDLGTAPQDSIDMLNSADLIIIGRSPASSDFEGDKRLAWNALTTPVILNNQWAARASHLNWFDHAGDPPHYDTEGEIVHAIIGNPGDVVFSKVGVEEDSLLPWIETPANLLSINTPTNGDLLAVSAPGDAGDAEGGAVLMVRFAAGTEFYEGAGESAAGSRTYFGFGNDHAGYPHFFGLTPQARQVYLDEINRILGTSLILPDDATLADVQVEGNAVTAFDVLTNTYSYLIPEAGDITVVATPNDSSATVHISGVGADSLVSVPEEGTSLDIVVTAVNGKTVNYTLNVRPLSDDATLSSLTVGEGDLQPAFSPDVTEYSITIPEGSTSARIDASPNQEGATIAGTGNIDVETGSGTATIVVTAETGTEKSYTVRVLVEGQADNADLANLIVYQGELVPAFDPAITEYTVEVDNGDGDFVNIAATPSVKDATVEGTTLFEFEDGGGTAHVVVTAVDGIAQKTYAITVKEVERTPTAVGSEIESPLKVYPTVSDSDFIVEFGAGAGKVTVYDTRGRVVATKSTTSNKASVSIQENGMFLFQVESRGIRKTFKVFKVN